MSHSETPSNPCETLLIFAPVATDPEKPASTFEYQDVKGDLTWLEKVSELKWEESPYGGLTLRGTCPACNDLEGINVFVPTVWVTGGGSSTPPTKAVSEQLEEATNLSTTSPKRQAKNKMKRKKPEFVRTSEMVLCCCNTKHLNTPTGKSGCGRWGYVPINCDPKSGQHGK